MRKGFIFDAALCVSCKACSAACILENGLQPGTRSLYTWNEHALPLFSIINLSLACNHCEKPSCASGCPAVAYTINADGVVIHHPNRCMGCGYCTWRCPYDAPKINRTLGYIEKCHLCADRTAEGIDPACVTACPTGALKMTERESFNSNTPAWFPDTGIGPSVIIKNATATSGPAIIPSPTGEDVVVVEEKEEEVGLQTTVPERIRQDWSLILFSLLIISASAIITVAGFQSSAEHAMIPFFLLSGAMAVSVAHLGRPERSWRAMLNIISSPLSREIAMVLLLAFVSLLQWIKPGLIPPLANVLIAILTVISIDLVYLAADKRIFIRLHTGQAFFTTLYAVSWFTAPRILFIAFTMLAAISIVLRYRSAEGGSLERIMYYIRAMTIPLVLLLIYPENPATDIAAIVLFVAGLIVDRLLFYCDFNPVNINQTIKEHFDTEYEKERDKQRQDTGLS